MELYQAVVIAIALANLAVTIWLLRLLIPIWQTLRKVVFALDNFDFDEISKKFLSGEKPLAESVIVKTSEKRDEGYRELMVTRIYKKPLDPREIQENFVRQMAERLQ